jgi:hypothetical protein
MSDPTNVVPLELAAYREHLAECKFFYRCTATEPGCKIGTVLFVVCQRRGLISAGPRAPVSGVSISPDGTTGTLEMGPPGEWQPGANDNSVANPPRVTSEGSGTLPESWQKLVRITATSIEPTPLFLLLAEKFETMESLLREAMCWLEDPSGYAQKGEPREFDERVRALLAEIAVAKGGG